MCDEVSSIREPLLFRLLTLKAGQNITLQGSQAKAGGQLAADAGHNLNILSDTTTTKRNVCFLQT